MNLIYFIKVKSVNSRRIKITKKLEELFNLPSENMSSETSDMIEENKLMIEEIDTVIDKIDAALPTVRGLEATEEEMDELAKLAKDKFNDLMDLGMNMEARFSGTVFQTAGVLLGHAITAKQAKLDKKLRMIDLQLKKQKLDKQYKDQGTEQPIEGESKIMDRNSLLAAILNKTTTQN
jgi:argininosuccinate lyase